MDSHDLKHDVSGSSLKLPNMPTVTVFKPFYLVVQTTMFQTAQSLPALCCVIFAQKGPFSDTPTNLCNIFVIVDVCTLTPTLADLPADPVIRFWCFGHFLSETASL